jgi:signal transduction histidine kinase
MSLMAISLLLLLTLTWQSFQSARTHLAAAEKVLLDYSQLAADEFARKIKGAVGYWVLYQTGQQLQGPAQSRQDRVDALMSTPAKNLREQQLAAIQAIEVVFEFDRQTPAVNTLYGTLSAERAAALMAALTAAVPDETSSEPYQVVHWSLESRTRTTVMFTATDGDQALGIDLSPDRLSDWFAGVFEREALLPKSIVDEPGNPLIYLRLEGLDRQVLFESTAGYDLYLMSEVFIGDDYAGLFEGFRVVSSIDPVLAPELVIGGLPRSRLPTLLLLIFLTGVVLAATFWLVLRDRALSRMRGQFVARVSHELRTPLTQIRMFGETLLLGRVDSEEKRREYLGIINREAQRLSHLVDNVLAFSGKEKTARSLVLETVELGELLDEVVSSYAPLAIARGDRLELQHDDQLEGRVDREAFKQILLNLLDNACKYGPEGQTVQARAWAEHDQICVAVQDAGPGIPDSDKEKVWQPYRRLAREERRAINGTGIGLSVARELILAMGGSYRVEDGDAGGARFVVSFPAGVQLP